MNIHEEASRMLALIMNSTASPEEVLNYLELCLEEAYQRGKNDILEEQVEKLKEGSK